MTRDPTGFLAGAISAFEARDRDRAAQAVQRLISAKPKLGATWNAVGRLAAALGEVESAISAARLFADDAPQDVMAQLQLCERLAQSGRHVEALKIGERLQADQPDLASPWHLTGVCRLQLGQRSRGVSDLRRAVACSEGVLAKAAAWQTIAGAKRFAGEDADLVAIRALLDTLGRDDREARSLLLYALGKAFDDRGETDRAFASYAQASSLVERATRMELDGGDALVEATIQAFDDTRSSRLAGLGSDSDRPIFVVGMPRSGTTLVEHVLASHPEVADGGELNFLQAAVMPIGGVLPKTIDDFAAASPQGLRAVADTYLRMLDQRFGVDGRIVDKTLHHTRFIGLIHAILPKARFVWVRREAGAVAWSCFKTRFTRGLSWTRSLEDIARYMKAEDRLHAHWSTTRPDLILTVPYEALAREPATWIPIIAEHVGLRYSDSMLAPHLTERVVSSASHSQVRHSIHTDAVDAWRRYEPHLAPFFDAYGRH